MKEYHFKVQHGEYTAELVIGGECSLYNFAAFIIKTIGFDFDHAFQFSDNLKNPYRGKECYSVFADMGQGDEGDLGVEQVDISEVFRPRRKMLFHFDFGDDWWFPVTCTAVKESAKKRRFKEVVATHGTPPVQYRDIDEE